MQWLLESIIAVLYYLSTNTLYVVILVVLLYVVCFLYFKFVCGSSLRAEEWTMQHSPSPSEEPEAFKQYIHNKLKREGAVKGSFLYSIFRPHSESNWKDFTLRVFIIGVFTFMFSVALQIFSGPFFVFLINQLGETTEAAINKTWDRSFNLNYKPLYCEEISYTTQRGEKVVNSLCQPFANSIVFSKNQIRYLAHYPQVSVPVKR